MLLLLACAGPAPEDTGMPIARFHGEGYAVPTVHGPEALLGQADCTMCHGADLSGAGAAGSCDECHDAGWRTDCTFCHGGTADSTGAPPRDIDGSTEGISFVAHPAHVNASDVADAFGCEQCHRDSHDALSAGHMFDGTPGTAELDFSAGLSSASAWDGTTCSNVYCHGSGQGSDGEIADGATVNGCDACHPGQASGQAGWDTMSGQHGRHLGAGIVACGDCHASVTGWDTLTERSAHVNGTVDVSPTAGMKWDGTGCTGVCHEQKHEGRVWR